MITPNNLETLQRKIGITFNNAALLQQALTHSSYINESLSSTIEDNERLEFLGDALLNFVVTVELYRNFPQLSEGELTELRIALIRQETLAKTAMALGLGEYLLLGKGEKMSGGKERETNLADAFEALLGAIFLDQGIEAARCFILAQLGDELTDAINQAKNRSYKALLQELTQAKFKQLPVYRVTEVSGPDHARCFTVEVRLGDKTLGHGSGRSKKSAEEKAAHSAWEHLTTEQLSGP